MIASASERPHPLHSKGKGKKPNFELINTLNI